LGGGYLIYLGINGLRARARKVDSIAIETAPEQSGLKTVGLGFLCNALNPKAPIYFVSLFTIVLSQDTPAQHLLIYGLWMMVLQLAWFAFLTMLLSRPAVTGKFHSMGHWIDRIAGGAMLLLGFKVLATRTS
jgi:threonine/homoserine/homoserine lactone efflux protein